MYIDSSPSLSRTFYCYQWLKVVHAQNPLSAFKTAGHSVLRRLGDNYEQNVSKILE